LSETVERPLVGRELLQIFDETFETHHGIYLDRGTSLFETLAAVTAEMASVPVGGRCATLAAQVAHVTLYLDVLGHHLERADVGRVDWGEVWRRVGAVDQAAWEALCTGLRASHAHVRALLAAEQSWDTEESVGGAIAIVVHTAYHLGEIRQALCTLGA
jgi:hypothetical protein